MNVYVYSSLLQHGESECNLYGRIGGDSPLSERGEKVSSHYWIVTWRDY